MRSRAQRDHLRHVIRKRADRSGKPEKVHRHPRSLLARTLERLYFARREIQRRIDRETHALLLRVRVPADGSALWEQALEQANRLEEGKRTRLFEEPLAYFFQ